MYKALDCFVPRNDGKRRRKRQTEVQTAGAAVSLRHSFCLQNLFGDFLAMTANSLR
jgi:hypothetical protein